MRRYFFVVILPVYGLCMAAISFEKSIHELSDTDVYAIWHEYAFSVDIKQQLTREIKRRSFLEIALRNKQRVRAASNLILIPYKQYYLKLFTHTDCQLRMRAAAERVYGAEYLRKIIQKYDLADFIIVPRKMVGAILGYPAVVAQRLSAVNNKRIMNISPEHIRALCILLKESHYCDISTQNVFVVCDKDGLYKVAIIDTEIRSFCSKGASFALRLKHRVPEEYYAVIDAYA